MRALRNFASSGSESANGSVPSSATLPPVGRSSVPRMCSSVLLPDPDGPITATASPRSSLMLTPRSTDSAPERVGYSFDTLSTTSDIALSFQHEGGQRQRPEAVEGVFDVGALVPQPAAEAADRPFTFEGVLLHSL